MKSTTSGWSTSQSSDAYITRLYVAGLDIVEDCEENLAIQGSTIRIFLIIAWLICTCPAIGLNFLAILLLIFVFTGPNMKKL